MDNLGMKIDELKGKTGEVCEGVATVADAVVFAAAAVPIYAAYKAGEGVVKGVKALGKWLGKQ